MRRAVGILLAGLGALCLGSEARALFVGVEEDNDVNNSAITADPVGDTSNTDPSGTSSAGERIVNPFDKTPALSMPETMPEEVVRRASERYNRPHNSRRFDRLLSGETETAAVSRPVVHDAAAESAPKAGKPGHALDYLIGVIVVGGVGVVGFHLLRGRTAS